MYSLYDKDGILRFVNSDREACLNYAELFELKSAYFYSINPTENVNIIKDVNFDLNQAENNN